MEVIALGIGIIIGIIIGILYMKKTNKPSKEEVEFIKELSNMLSYDGSKR